MLFVPLHFSFACGGWDDEDMDEYTSFFRPEMLRLSQYAPYFFSYHYSYTGDGRTYLYKEKTSLNSSAYDISDEEFENLNDWKRYFGNNIPLENIDKLIYDAYDYRDNDFIVGLLKKRLSGNHTPINKDWTENLAVKYILDHKDNAVIDYLDFAHRALKFSRSWPNYSGYEISSNNDTLTRSVWLFKRDKEKIDSFDYQVNKEAKKVIREKYVRSLILKEALDKYKSSTSDFLKMRYAFQFVRLAYYSGQRQQCLKLYKDLVEPLHDPGPLPYWSLGYKAGAEYSEAKAAYDFSRIFKADTGKRWMAFKSFRLEDDMQMDSVMQMCKTNDEKANVLFLASIDPTAFMTDNMRKIYALTPRNEELDVLLSREMNKMENVVFSADNYSLNFSEDEADTISRAEYIQYIRTNFIPFVDEVVRNGGGRRKEAWDFCSAYLRYLVGDSREALERLDNFEKKYPKDDEYSLSVNMLMPVIISDTATAITPDLEKHLLTYLKQVEAPGETSKKYIEDAKLIVNRKLAILYKKINPEFTWLLLDRSLETDPDTAAFFKRLNFMQQKDSGMVGYIQSLQNYNIPALKARISLTYLYFGDFSTASKWVIPDDMMDETAMLPANPFVIHLTDCHYCDFEALKTKLFTRSSFADTMLNLMHAVTVVKNNDKKAQYYYLLGNGLYNISSFGNSWMVNEQYLSYLGEGGYSNIWYGNDYQFDDYVPDGLSLPSLKDKILGRSSNEDIEKSNDQSSEEDVYSDLNKSNFKVPDSLSPNQLVMAEKYYTLAAKLTSSREFAAKCYAMAAKCVNGRRGQDYSDNPYYEVLVKQYPKTKYYHEILSECGYFAEYIKGN
jgi:hypothetical protein